MFPYQFLCVIDMVVIFLPMIYICTELSLLNLILKKSLINFRTSVKCIPPVNALHSSYNLAFFASDTRIMDCFMVNSTPFLPYENQIMAPLHNSGPWSATPSHHIYIWNYSPSGLMIYFDWLVLRN
jgi:hypothetical protein